MSKVKLTTTLGEITITLFDEKAPISVNSFLDYVKNGHYNGTIFHRVISGFMAQGGGYEPNMIQKPTNAPIKNEANNGLKNDMYTVAMARTQNPDSAAAQFFINFSNNSFLNYSSSTPQGWGYAVFGEVTEGQNVVDEIQKTRTGKKSMYSDVPVTDIIITEAKIIQ
ncbi:cyclophilin [Pseudomonas sp. ICMP 8385]|uniref:peptidylprolyl isomerase n=1 Tax=Pseudomonas sp. ICMP 8385 TaxID=1718920 RepID=UPI000C073D3A|nr:peptidylprolyl isomerase [Pseudomonas sp. ICMP 8385]PHN65933.1 cyclophilin [Pseudomonas sp. ICMP 8385]